MPPGILKATNETDTVATGGGSSNEICWSDLTVYEFPNILGDNPAVSEGVPLSIGWKHQSQYSHSIDMYEFVRQSRPRRKRKDLVIKSGNRDTFLLGEGYTLEQLIDAAEETKKIRASRRANMKGTWDKFKSLYDIATGSVRNKKGFKEKLVPKIVAAKSG